MLLSLGRYRPIAIEVLVGVTCVTLHEVIVQPAYMHSVSPLPEAIILVWLAFVP